MIDHAKRDPEIAVVLIHDFSRFSRNSVTAKSLLNELSDKGVKVISLTDPEFDPESVMGCWMEHITFAKNEAYSREVAFHTRKGCKANIRTRDEQTGWCYKNGGIPLWGYKAVRLERGFERKGIPIIKVIWDLDDTIVAGRPAHEWIRHCLVELAMKGASIIELRDFCNQHGIPARINKHWSHSTWKSLLTAPALLKYCGYEVWNVRRKNGSFKPMDEWEIVENAHPAIITEDEARKIAEVRKSNSKEKRFDKGFGISRKSSYLLSGGLMKCDRCGSNMVGFRKDKSHPYYVCGSIQYRRGEGCGSGVYIPQKEIEDEVVEGLNQLMRGLTVTDGLTQKVNQELHRIWEETTGVTGNTDKELKSIEIKIQNLYQAVEDGLPFDSSMKTRLHSLQERKSELGKLTNFRHNPPKIDVETVIAYKNKHDRVLKCSNHAESKKFIRECVENIKLVPDDLEVEITYKLPKPVVDVHLAQDV